MTAGDLSSLPKYSQFGTVCTATLQVPKSSLELFKQEFNINQISVKIGRWC